MELTLSINQIAKVIAANGADKTYIVEGPMGSGKSSIPKIVEAMYGDKYNYITVDCTQLDVGDIQVPDTDRTQMVTRYLPNVLFVGDGTKPMFINLDEIGKAPRSVQNALLPVALEHRVGVRPLPAGSVVMGATNLGAEGVGDLFQPHARNRVSFLEMRYPTNEEWVNDWAIEHGVHHAMLAWAMETPELFRSFKDVADPKDNPFIFHPREQRKSFVTPRSLYLASLELRDVQRDAVGDKQATLAAIAGNIGARAALDLMAFVDLADKLPAWDLIVNAPDSAPVPDKSPAAMMMTVHRAISRVERETIDPVMTYIKRMPKELQCVFTKRVLGIRSKSGTIATHRGFSQWVAQNHWLLK